MENIPGNGRLKSLRWCWELRRITKWKELKAAGEARLQRLRGSMGGDKTREVVGTRSSKSGKEYCISPKSNWKPLKVTED